MVSHGAYVATFSSSITEVTAGAAVYPQRPGSESTVKTHLNTSVQNALTSTAVKLSSLGAVSEAP